VGNNYGCRSWDRPYLSELSVQQSELDEIESFSKSPILLQLS
jgi:hypothetical protein